MSDEETKTTKGGRGAGKITPKKSARDLKRDMDAVINTEINKEGFVEYMHNSYHLSIAFLVNCMLGDESIVGLSATNRVQAAKEVKDIAEKLIGVDRLTAIVEQAKEEADKEEAKSKTDNKSEANVFTLPRFEAKK